MSKLKKMIKRWSDYIKLLCVVSCVGRNVIMVWEWMTVRMKVMMKSNVLDGHVVQ